MFTKKTALAGTVSILAVCATILEVNHLPAAGLWIVVVVGVIGLM